MKSVKELTGAPCLRQILYSYSKDMALKMISNTMLQQEQVLEKLSQHGSVETLAMVSHKSKPYPIYKLSLGSSDPSHLQLAFIGGVHGLERIGSEVLISYMHTISELLEWDESFKERLKTSRLIFIPVLNPVGVETFRRANGRGVDLMRNGSLVAKPPGGPWYRGQKISSKLPWYQGREKDQLEVESQALFDFVRKDLFQSPLSLTLDVHSGFGAKDRLWFPFAHTHEPFHHLPEAYRLKLLLDKTYPHNFYEVEPMSKQYTIHGDLWDELYLEGLKREKGVFLPLTLEMGSWNWLKKNPLQVFSRLGAFHPMKPHRHHRILRRHINLFDFLHRSLMGYQTWWPKTAEERVQLEKKAKELWYS